MDPRASGSRGSEATEGIGLRPFPTRQTRCCPPSPIPLPSAPRADLDVFLVAPKGPGSALRSLYEQGKGMIARWAVAQDASGSARGLALAYGRAIGCARAGLIGSTFAEECEADLFNEQAVVWG
ncbi:MAG: hypothetical protein KY453_12975, partial [Gemmatimonadetes bacterium]|nr:hypothetical protein [Gemmatimonadota bacterium]